MSPVGTGTLRVVEREARVFRQLWRGVAFSMFVSPLLYLAAMGLGLGALVDQSTGTVDGLTYLAFVTPGLLAATAVQGAAAESLWPVMLGTKWMRFYHGTVATPITTSELVVGTLAWIGCRLAMQATVFLAVAAVLGGVDSPWAPLAVPAAILGGLAFAAPLCAFSATQDTDVTFSVIMRLGILPLFLFSGTFFPIDQLPGWLQPVAWLSPLWHAVALCRAATTGAGDWLLPVHVLILLAFIAGGTAWATRTFRARLTP